MCTSQQQRDSCEAASATGHGKRVHELGQDTSGYGEDELREIVDGLVGRIRKLERELQRSQKRGSQDGKRKAQRPRAKGGAGEAAYRKSHDDGQVTDEQDAPEPIEVATVLVGQNATWALSFRGGDFWLCSGDGGNSRITRYRYSGDKAFSVVVPVTGMRIVGAGVSTCAPVEPLE